MLRGTCCVTDVADVASAGATVVRGPGRSAAAHGGRDSRRATREGVQVRRSVWALCVLPVSLAVHLRHCCPSMPHTQSYGQSSPLTTPAHNTHRGTARRRKRAKQLAKLRKKVAAVKKANHGKAEGDTDKVPLPPALLHVPALALDRAGGGSGAPLLHHRWLPLASEALRVRVRGLAAGLLEHSVAPQSVTCNQPSRGNSHC